MTGAFTPDPANPWCRTLDGALITEGLVVWDYDLRRSRVTFGGGEFSAPGGRYWDGWYEMRHPETGQLMSTMNGERMWVRHPRTGERA